MEENLNAKEKLFCTYYSLNRNAREAAAKSGYRFAERTAISLLKREEILEEIEKLDSLRKSTTSDIAAGYYRLAFGCVSDAISLIFCEDEIPKNFEKLDLFNVADIKRQKNGCIEIKFFDRLKALEKLENLCTSVTESGSSFYSAIEKGASALRKQTNE
ncbi:MAG: terminase small subunit [Clostridia bacterium]